VNQARRILWDRRETAMHRQWPGMAFAMLITVAGSFFILALFPGWTGLLWAAALVLAMGIWMAAWGWNGPWGLLFYLWTTALFFLIGFPLNTMLIAGGWAMEQTLLPMDYESI